MPLDIANPRVRALLLGLAVFGLYALTRTCAHSGDDLQWIMQVDSAVTGTPIWHPASTMLSERVPPLSPWNPQPRYLLALPTVATLTAAARRGGWATSAIGPVQLLHALLGSLGVAWFYLAMRRVVGERWSLAASLGLSSSYAWWYYSTHLDYPIAGYALSGLFLLFLFRTFASDSGESPVRNAFALGVCTTLAGLYLATRIVLVAVVAVVAAAARGRGTVRSVVVTYAAGVLSSLALLLGVCTLWSVLTTGALPDVSHLRDRMVYAGSYAHQVAPLDVPKALYGMAKSLIVYPAQGAREPRQVMAEASPLVRFGLVAWYGALAVLAGVPFVLATWRRRLLRTDRVPVIALLSWFVFELPFIVYWEPTYVKWFAGLLVPWWGLVAVLGAHGFADRPRAARAFAAASIGLVGLGASVNLLCAFWPASRCAANPWLRASATLARQSAAADVFVALEPQPLDFYLLYFGGRRVVAADRRGGSAEAVRSVLAATARRGGRIYVYPCSERYQSEIAALAPAVAGPLEPLSLDSPAPGFSVCATARVWVPPP